MTYEEMVKELIRNKNWFKKDEHQLAERINHTPYFLIRNNYSMYLHIAMEDDDKMVRLLGLTPKVAKLVSLDKRVSVLSALIQDTSNYQNRSVTNKIITSFGWMINSLIQENREDGDFILTLLDTLNACIEELAQQGYKGAKIHYTNGKVEWVSQITLEDVMSEMLEVDILKEEDITIAY